jgi:hypothetical protein
MLSCDEGPREDPSYAASSYTWGDPLAIPYRVTARSKYLWGGNEPLAVTETLYKALLKLEMLDTRWCW